MPKTSSEYHSQATTALALAVVGIFTCLPISFVGMYLGRKANEGLADLGLPPNGSATAAFRIGRILAVLFVIGLVAILGIAVFVAFGGPLRTMLQSA